jgi:kumamolisin
MPVKISRPKALAAAALAAVSAAALIAMDGDPDWAAPGRIAGPYANLLEESIDLGPARDSAVQVTAALRNASRPGALIGWAREHGLAVRWDSGEEWAFVEGPAAAVADAASTEATRTGKASRQALVAEVEQVVAQEMETVTAVTLGTYKEEEADVAVAAAWAIGP